MLLEKNRRDISRQQGNGAAHPRTDVKVARRKRQNRDSLNTEPANKIKGNIALHEIIAEPSLVSYWEKFGAIAFDHTQKAILTSCSLKNPDPHSKDPEIRCCFSFTVKRDAWNM
jgi:hypothetical protein